MRSIHELAAEYGVGNIRAFIPMQRIIPLHDIGLPIGITDSDDEEVIQECVIEEDRYKVDDHYKITFRAIGNSEEFYYGCKHFYQMDFDNLRRRHPDLFKVFVLVDEDNKYERIG